MNMLGSRLTRNILLAMCAGVAFGLLLRVLPLSTYWHAIIVDRILNTAGVWFIRLLKMLIVPVVFVSLVCGVSALKRPADLGRMGLRAILLYLFTTAIAISLALFVAQVLNVGHSATAMSVSSAKTMLETTALSFHQLLAQIMPANPLRAMVEGNLLQLIIFSLLFGLAITMAGKHGEPVARLFTAFNAVVMSLVSLVMAVSPIGIFCLLAHVFVAMGWAMILQLLSYFSVVLLVLFLQWAGVYSALLWLLARCNPWYFVKNIASALLFAFSVSSSAASIPVMLSVVKEKLNVSERVASFVIPLGATINMDGTAIMQGVATVFIAHVYHVNLSLSQYITVVVMATLASIGTAGVPSVGLITLAMVLKQVGLPVEGIGLIMGIDRLLDMCRTMVNVTGDAMVACVVQRFE